MSSNPLISVTPQDHYKGICRGVESDSKISASGDESLDVTRSGSLLPLSSPGQNVGLPGPPQGEVEGPLPHASSLPFICGESVMFGRAQHQEGAPLSTGQAPPTTTPPLSRPKESLVVNTFIFASVYGLSFQRITTCLNPL